VVGGPASSAGPLDDSGPPAPFSAAPAMLQVTSPCRSRNIHVTQNIRSAGSPSIVHTESERAGLMPGSSGAINVS
jgi:hypothetical protein